MKIPILVLPSLQKVLLSQGVSVSEYLPAYGGESAGLDLYSTMEEPVTFYGSCHNPIGESSGAEIRLISTGLKVALPEGTVGLIQERGSVTKTPVVKRAGVIDRSYTGEIFVNLAGLCSFGDFTIKPGDKLPVQLIVVPVYNDYTSVTDEEYTELTSTSKRGSGKVGSSDGKA